MADPVYIVAQGAYALFLGLPTRFDLPNGRNSNLPHKMMPTPLISKHTRFNILVGVVIILCAFHACIMCPLQ